MRIEIKYQHSDDDKEYVKVFEFDPDEFIHEYESNETILTWLWNLYSHHETAKELEADLLKEDNEKKA